MIHLLTHVKTVTFLSGAVVGAVALPILKSKPVRTVAVSALSKGFMVKNAVESQLNNLWEEAEDLCAEAVEKAQENKEAESDDFLDFLNFDEDDTEEGETNC